MYHKKINAAALEEKEHYTEEETAKICGELIKEGGLIRIVAQNFVVRLSNNLDEDQKEKIRVIRERNEEVQKLVRDALAENYLKVEKEEEGEK